MVSRLIRGLADWGQPQTLLHPNVNIVTKTNPKGHAHVWGTLPKVDVNEWFDKDNGPLRTVMKLSVMDRHLT